MSGLLILGAGGHGRVVADIAQTLGWTDIAFLDDAADLPPPLPDCPVLGPLDRHLSLRTEFDAAIIALGNNALRQTWLRTLIEAGWTVPALVHPAATVSRHGVLEAGVTVCPGAVVGVLARIGQAAIVNTGASVDHDCVVGAAVHISPGAHIGGGTTIGDRSWIGIGAAICHGLTIGADTVVGAGAAVIQDLPSGVRAVGVPAVIK